MVFHEKPTKNTIKRGLKLRRFAENQINLHSKSFQNLRTVIKSNEAYFLTTQLQIFIRISRIGLPGIQLKVFTYENNDISQESASLTESETLGQ